MAEERIPAQVFHPGEYLRDELESRGWDSAKMACEMPGDPQINQFIVDCMLAALEAPHDHAIQDVRLGMGAAIAIASVFGTSPELWMNLDESWNKHRDRRCWPDTGEDAEA